MLRTHVPLVVLALTTLVGADCSPTPPGCPFDGECADGESRSCINFCVPVFDGDIVDESVLCALDDCDDELFSSPTVDIWRCPGGDAAGDGYTCAPFADSPDPERIGRCQPARNAPGVCDPERSHQCEPTTFCLSMSNCPEQTEDPHLRGVPADAAGHCWLPQREGEGCDSNIDDPKCLPCEAGTLCADTSTGPRCLRTCTGESVDDPRPELCDCDAGEASCLPHESLVPAGGEFAITPEDPQFLCDPPGLANGTRCDPEGEGLACADPSSECREGADGSGEFTCCRAFLASCTSNDDCCDGSAICSAGSCVPCAQEGQEVEAFGCCPGLTPIEGICRSCSSDPQGREGSLFGGDSCDGDYVGLLNGNDRLVFAVPREGNTGAGVAELGGFSGNIDQVDYNSPDHHVFLLQGDLTGTWSDRQPPGDPPGFLPSASESWPPAGSTVAHAFAQLPTVDGLPVFFDTASIAAPPGFPPNTWESVRVYHGGACSDLITWANITDALAMTVSRFLVEPQFGIFGSEPLTLQDAHITPILHSGAGPDGRSADDDQVHVFLQYGVTDGEAFGCPGGIIRLNIGLRLRRNPSVEPTFLGELEDRFDFRTTPHECLPNLITELEGRFGEGNVTDCTEVCHPEGTDYICEHLFSASGSPVTSMERRTRETRSIRGAYDFVPEIVFVRGGLDTGCHHSSLNHFLRQMIGGAIKRRLDGVLNELVNVGAVNLPSAALGIDYEDMPLCGRTHPVTGETIPSNALCTDRFDTLGGRRHRCVGFDADRRRTDVASEVAEYRCGQLRSELRRINIRPDGLELVLANDSTDGQFPSFNTRRPDLCGAGRAAAATGPRFGPIANTRSRLIGMPGGARRICHPDDLVDGTTTVALGCRGICSDRGVACGGNIVRAAIDRNAAVPDRCFVPPFGEDRGRGFCCDPANLCNVPASAGGIQLSGSEDAPTPADFFRCVDRQSDNTNCGSCGTVCSGTDQCVAGVCQPAP
ncbi:MAG: hypothetical protein AAGE52_04375 [Myxococcota bacterium]